MGGVWQALTESGATTDPRAPHRDLRGRTYAIPFDRVWTAALKLAREESPRWTVTMEDDENGVILAERRTLLLRRVDDVRVDLGLDENGQTRVDLEGRARRGKRDMGRNARTIRRFLRRLDLAVEATPLQILDARRPPSFSA